MWCSLCDALSVLSCREVHVSHRCPAIKRSLTAFSAAFSEGDCLTQPLTVLRIWGVGWQLETDSKVCVMSSICFGLVATLWVSIQVLFFFICAISERTDVSSDLRALFSSDTEETVEPSTQTVLLIPSMLFCMLVQCSVYADWSSPTTLFLLVLVLSEWTPAVTLRNCFPWQGKHRYRC